jgi:hypothetical protein
MPTPIKIPSLSRKTPIVKILDPIKYSDSSATIGSAQAEIQGLLSPSSIGQVFFRLNSKLVIAARKLNLNTNGNLSIGLIKNEINRKLTFVATQTERNYIDEASYALFEAEKIDGILKKLAEDLAVKDVLGTRRAIAEQVSNASIRDELNAIVDSISRNTRFNG